MSKSDTWKVNWERASKIANVEYAKKGSREYDKVRLIYDKIVNGTFSQKIINIQCAIEPPNRISVKIEQPSNC